MCDEIKVTQKPFLCFLLLSASAPLLSLNAEWFVFAARFFFALLYGRYAYGVYKCYWYC